MPMAEAAVQAVNLVEIVVPVLTGCAGVVGAGYVGLVRLTTKIDAMKEDNDKSHERIEKALCRQNGSIDHHGEQLASVEARCEERHRHG